MIEHGTASRYVNKKCRCEACKTAWAAYHRAYYRKRRQASKMTVTDENRPTR